MKPNWITRLFVTLTTIALVIVGFFFLTVALVAGAALALVIGVRFWWTLRKLRRAQGTVNRSAGTPGAVVVDGEYRVIEVESGVPKPGQDRTPPSPNNTPPAP